MPLELRSTDKQFALIGRMVMAWNEAELVWFLIYTCLVYQLPRSTAEAIFKKSASGNSQRELILAAAEVALASADLSDLLEFIRKAKNETNNLSVERNDIVHGDYHYSLETAPATFSELANAEFSISLSSGRDWRKRANIFAGRNLDEELPALIGDIKKLITQLDQIRDHRFIPEQLRGPTLSSNIPAELRSAMIASHPELEPPTIPLIWQTIRPQVRQPNVA